MTKDKGKKRKAPAAPRSAAKGRAKAEAKAKTAAAEREEKAKAKEKKQVEPDKSPAKAPAPEPAKEPVKAKAKEERKDIPPPAADLSIVSLEDEMQRSYLDYAMSVIIGRAIPDVKDGLKPVHRRVLYALYESGTHHNKPYKKSARIVGDVIGKYHPHGDVAVYDTLVRLAQDFSMRYVLVDGQGNFGSVDGDPPAAMRYTEVRMKKIAGELLADIEKDTVNFVPNYDESLEMPEVLPAKFPNLLVNGGNGIAVGMASNIPPHNLGEVIDGVVHLIQHPKATLKEIMHFVAGPDFPTGGIIYGRKGILDAYKGGRGVIQVRAKTLIERGGKGGRDAIVVTEIPYQVNKSRLLESIADLVNTKRVEGIADIRDESDREGMRIVIEVKRGDLPEVILNSLFKHTQLQTSFGIILLAIVEKQPKLLGLVDMMKYFISHRQDVVKRRTRFELKRAEARAHILEGLVICLDHLDAIIKLIRASANVDEARRGLIARFRMSPIQAQAVLDMPLQRLTKLEREKIVREYEELKKEIARLRKILASDKLMLDIIVEELKAVKEEYQDERRTEIRSEMVTDIRPEDLIKEEDVAIVHTQSGYVKRTSLNAYRYQGRGGKGRKGISMKAEDIVENLFVCSTHSYLLIFTDKGRMHWLKALDIPDVGPAGRGRSINNILEIGAEEKARSVVAVKEFSDNEFIIMLSTDGQIKKTRLSDFQNVRRGGINAMGLRGKAELFAARITNGKQDILIGTRLGRALRFKESELRPMGRQAAGVKAIRLKPKDAVIGMVVVGAEDRFVFTASERGYGKKTEIKQYPRHRRGGQGVINIRVTPKIGNALTMVGIAEEDLLVMTVEGKLIKIRTTQLRPLGRGTQGVRIIHLDPKDRVCSVAKAGEE